MTGRPSGPHKSPKPDYVEPGERPTGEYSLADVVHELKVRRRQRWKEILGGIAGIIVAIGTATASIVRAFDHGSRIEKIEEKQKEETTDASRHPQRALPEQR